MKKAIFTVLMDGYDHFPRPAKNNPTWDKILFIDEDVSKYAKSMWTKVIKLDYSHRPDIASRDIKWRSHIHLPEYDLVCYHDANITVRRQLPIRPFRVAHDKRFSIREEANALNGFAHRCTSESVEKQLQYYDGQGFPDDQGLFYGGFFARYHRPEINEVCEMVFDHVKRFTSRDQLSFPYAMWDLDYKPENIVDRKFFKANTSMHPHKKKHLING